MFVDYDKKTKIGLVRTYKDSPRGLRVKDGWLSADEYSRDGSFYASPYGLREYGEGLIELAHLMEEAEKEPEPKLDLSTLEVGDVIKTRGLGFGVVEGITVFPEDSPYFSEITASGLTDDDGDEYCWDFTKEGFWTYDKEEDEHDIIAIYKKEK